MKLDFKFSGNKQNVSKTQLISAAGFFWQKISKFVLFTFLIGAVFMGGYIWRKSLSGDTWSAEKKQEYLDTQNKGVVFNEDAYRKVLSDIEMRKQEVASDNNERKDIFKAY